MRTYSFLFSHPNFSTKLHVKWKLDNGIVTTTSNYSCDEPHILAADTGKVDGRPGFLNFISGMVTGLHVASLTTPAGFPGWDDCAINVDGAISSINFASGFAAPKDAWRWALIGRWDG